ncbi:hypothetical protein DRN73_06530 [Candidatus Pacearchaeota archaeon]|nr:MAG: hypothetical protein DRN73_06530 [Candidatus Pacearchaeota archaeon]
MKLINFNFKKISVDKIANSYKDLNLSTKINISEILPIESKFFKGDEDLVKVKFSYIIDYSPNIAKVELNGELVLAIEKTLSKGIIEAWKEKKITDDFRLTLFNLILRKSTVKALELEEEMNLPLHIPPPTLKKPEKKEKE